MRCISAEKILLLSTVCGVLLGILCGLILRDPEHRWTKRQLNYVRFPGDLFVRMLKMLILPLIMTTIITSVASVDPGTASRIGFVSLIYYFVTTMMAVTIGIALVVTVKPGRWFAVKNVQKSISCITNPIDTILDLIKSMFPDNLIEATFKSEKMCMKFYNGTVEIDSSVALQMTQEERMNYTEIPSVLRSDGTNILGLVMFSVSMGIAISVIGEEGLPLKMFFKSFEAVSMKLISLVIWFSPIGVLFLITAQIIAMENPGHELNRLMGYMICVLAGLAIHAIVVLPTLMIVFARRNPIKYVYGMSQALLTALATSSSSATLPLSIKCAEENNGVDPRVARFVLPLGATVNMDGTALYEAVAAIYISQCANKNLTAGQLILTSLTATLASVGAAGIPQAGIVTMIMVLIALGLPSNLFILIYPVDFFLDRIRTTVNVHGDSIGAAIIAKICERYLPRSAGELNEDGYCMLPADMSTPQPCKRQKNTEGQRLLESHHL
uniref:Amino acid transporter n=1 Tax=Syphacia muris TaxID=451379 RepID=A0A158R3T2_9BILA